ncbi:hypothetical protein V8G54_009945 [Vigna mungo]|uniref:Uncharacterized protein n=1 Tax=Vigna mungo TaxID=3915 RepID=A0AAQ3NWP1_VIGMU
MPSLWSFPASPTSSLPKPSLPSTPSIPTSSPKSPTWSPASSLPSSSKYSLPIKILIARCRLLETIQAFEELTSLPNMCGAIGTTHVHLCSTPNNNPNLNPYRYRYGYPSLLLQVISDHKKIF